MIRVLNFRPFRKHTLRGYPDLELSGVGLILRGWSWHENEKGEEWVSLPSCAYRGSDGVERWTPIVEFAPGATKERQGFQEQAALIAVGAVATAEAEE